MCVHIGPENLQPPNNIANPSNLQPQAPSGEFSSDVECSGEGSECSDDGVESEDDIDDWDSDVDEEPIEQRYSNAMQAVVEQLRGNISTPKKILDEPVQKVF